MVCHGTKCFNPELVHVRGFANFINAVFGGSFPSLITFFLHLDT